ncbi:MAG: TetR/AcrR family transcriptional regulator [Myxococcota bacterium]
MTDPNAGSIHERVRSRRKQEYRRAILDAAAEVFGQAGYGATKMSAIAQAAGVAIGTLYNYFDSKREVFDALLERAQEQMLERITNAAPGSVGLPRVHAILRETLASVEECGQLYSVQMEAVGNNDGGLDIEAHKRAYFVYVGLLREAIEQALTQGELRSDLGPNPLALALMGSCRAFIADWMLSDRSQSVVDQADRIMELFVKGAGPR